MVFDELAHGYERCAVCGIPLSEMTASICTACRRKLQQREVDQLQAENERLRAERNEAFEILSRLFDGSCFDCAFLEHCDKKGVAWDAYNIGTVARIDCLGAK